MNGPKHVVGWHKAQAGTMRRCSRCLELIGAGRYWGSASVPDRIICAACRTGHKAAVKVPA